MNHERYNAITAPYYGRQKKRLLLAALLMVLGYMLAATGIGGIVGIVSMIYLMMEGIRTFSMRKLKKTFLVQMEQKGILTDALISLDAATLLQVDGLTYALTDGYLFLPHGALLALDDIAWIYQSEQTIRYMMIPVAKIRLCKVALLDGTDTLAFYGNAKDKQAFGALLSSLKAKIPHLLMGYSTENQRIYQALVAAHKSNPAG